MINVIGLMILEDVARSPSRETQAALAPYPGFNQQG